jgi:branched-chain amino acid transport system ATP-binding protein
MTGVPLLNVRGLTMRFGGLTAVDNVSFAVLPRTITSLIGPNGAGKTTVFNCITGFYSPASGEIFRQSQGEMVDLHGLGCDEVCRKGRVVRTFQNIRLFKGMSLLENLLVAQHNELMQASWWSIAGLFGLPHFRRCEEAAVDRARFWLRRIGLLEKADEPAGDLSYGDQRRLEIARAMCTRPELLCLDEPAAGLNATESAQLSILLRSIRDEHQTTVLLIEHDMSVVMEVSDSIVVLEHGKKIAEGNAREIRNNAEVIRAYLGEDDTHDEVGTIVGGGRHA